MKIAFFDSKPYIKKVFENLNQEKHYIRFFEPKLNNETIEFAKGFECVCVFVNDCLDDAIIHSLKEMGVSLIALRCKGSDNLDIQACQKHGLEVVKVSHYSPYSVAEHAVALILALNRHIHKAYNRIRDGNFSLDGLQGFDLHGKMVGVIGAGEIGKAFINIMMGFGCKVIVYDVLGKNTIEDFPNEQVTFAELSDLYEKSDIISLHVPLTIANRHMISGNVVQKMKSGVMLINTSRGGLIDTEAMIEGVKSKKIGYVGLDVYENEAGYFFEDLSDSVITDDALARLMTFPNVIVTGHQAFLTQEALIDIAKTTLQSVAEFEQGKHLSCSLI